MPLIDLKSDLAARVTTALNDNERRVEDSSRLLKLLAGGVGLTFAAKQAMLDPKSALIRLASITAQLGLNSVPFGLGNHIGFNPNGFGISNIVQGTAAERTLIRDKASQYQEIATKVTDWTPYSNPGYITDGEFPLVDKQTTYTNIVTKPSDWTKHQSDPGYLDENPIDSDVTAKVAMDREADLNTVPFYFTSYSVSNGQLTNGSSLAFPAFFNSISDNTNGNWNSFSYTGRGESFHVYQTYGRTMQINFKVAAFNYGELRRIDTKIGKLRSTAAPTYSSSTGYMKGTFLKLTIGTFVRSLPGFVTSVGFTIDDNVPWETNSSRIKIPHVIDVSVGYTVIEQNTPQFSF